MSKFKIKIVAPCLNMEEKQQLFESLDKVGAEIRDYVIDFKTYKLMAWLAVPQENENKFQRYLENNENNFTILSSSRGGAKTKSGKKKKKKHGKAKN